MVFTFASVDLYCLNKLHNRFVLIAFLIRKKYGAVWPSTNHTFFILLAKPRTDPLRFGRLLRTMSSKSWQITVLHMGWEPALEWSTLEPTAYISFSYDIFNILSFLDLEATRFSFSLSCVLAFWSPPDPVHVFHLAQELWENAFPLISFPD